MVAGSRSRSGQSGAEIMEKHRPKDGALTPNLRFGPTALAAEKAADASNGKAPS